MTDFIPRRSFIKAAGLGLVGLGIAGTASRKEQEHKRDSDGLKNCQ